jgi:hypothetical protein
MTEFGEFYADAFGSTNSDLKGNVMLSEIYLSDISSEAQNRGIYYPFTSRSFESVLTLLSSATEDDLKAFISEEVLDLTNPGTLYSRLEHDFLNTTANSKNYFLYFSSVYNTESNLTLGTLSPNTKINEGVFCVGGAIVKKNSQMLSYTWAIFKSEDKWLIASIARTVQNPSSEQRDWKYDDSVLKNLKEISKDKNPDAIIYEGMNKNLGLKWIMDQLGLVEADFVYP